jgi:hypothetical protein
MNFLFHCLIALLFIVAIKPFESVTVTLQAHHLLKLDRLPAAYFDLFAAF